jgi:predicted ATP-dependent protease
VKLEAADLFRACDPGSLGFETTAEVEPLVGHVGQDEALAALEFGVGTSSDGYNVFVLGRAGSGRLTNVRRVLSEYAASQPTPPDRCYVHNFEEARRPAVLTLGPGRGPVLQADVASLVAELRAVVPKALEGDDVSRRRGELMERHLRASRETLEKYRKELEADPLIALVGDDEGFTVMPARGGEPLSPAAFEALPQPLYDEVNEHLVEARRRLMELQRHLHQLQGEAESRVEELHREVTRAVVAPRMAALREDYEDEPEVVAFLNRVEEDVLRHGRRFLVPSEEILPGLGILGEDFFVRYEVNVVVTHAPDSGAPVVVENNPTLRNLFGHVGGQARFGVLTTDFTRIIPGAMHRANGGYLVLQVADVLSRPFSWNALERTLRSKELLPGDTGLEIGLPVPQTLEPQPIPTQMKVVLVGEPHLYYLLRALDPEFERLFKTKVDFAPRMDRTRDAERAYAAFVASVCQKLGLAPFHAAAVARLVEQGSRRAGDQAKLTTQLSHVEELVIEAGRAADGAEVVTEVHVEAALAARRMRERRPERELLELIERGVLAFDPHGERVGQLHGIALLGMGDEPIGRPIRVLATAYLGAEGVVNIEREAKLAGPIHTKGFLVLSGYLGRHFAREHPLVLSASLSFDQLYEEVEGDSASAAELYALLSAISGVPLRQGIGVTGAINQEGLLLPVGGVTHKVEGFFAACLRRGLDGEQGVLLPRRNVENLTLSKQVRDAVDAGRFHIWAADAVEEGWPVLTGKEAGVADADGRFAEGTVYGDAQVRLRTWAETIRRFGGATPGAPTPE